MIVVPALMPDTIPVDTPTVPTLTLLLLQIPPGVVQPSVVVKPVQTEAVPVIDAAKALTLTVILEVFTQPLALVPVTV
jgi:hypothetical protein